VSAAASNDVWAVGEYIDDTTFNAHTLFEHWNGSQWSVVAGPNPGTAINILYGVSAVSSSDVWAVGFSSDDGSTFQTLIVHWDGASWSRVSSPNPGANNLLYGVTAVASNNVWAVGQTLGSAPSDQALIVHWDGLTWSAAKAADVPGRNDVLFGVSSAGGNVFAAGNSEGTSPKQTLTEVLSGGRWSVVPSANPSDSDNKVFGVAAVSAGNVFAVGNTLDSNGNAQTLVEQYNGTSFGAVSVPSPGSSDNFLGGAAAAPSGDVWAAGALSSTKNDNALALHGC
jgi:hypothetical protein